ncbi:uncharacterized protein I303_100326 [Kwoniella dejecticola CBS 10117]|uniref:Uncharacterized protein n=1 Tax=Kwoniella dejecticola CBS 10117 TaxID=1296121 RepID=A0A1A6AEL8_9TREE|nr:uncharacterized protein I303_00327 [Kwoniella dejecticola CBS 10117]OBR88510.1 hypothetical protein I303_00327 [Kwoniella dejecticola CBS 10117]
MAASTSSLLPVLALGGAWYYLLSRGATTQTVWLLMNILDTFRALRHIRPNGRRIGINTRKKAMRDSLLCWSIFVAAQTISPILSTCLGWIPFYSPIKVIITIAFLALRVPASSHLFYHFLGPSIKPYETPIDLTVLLIESIGVLIFHYALQVPSSLLLRSASLVIRFAKSAIHEVSTLLRPSRIPLAEREETPTVDDDSIRASFLSPPPQIPGSILLRHPSPRPLTPRRSISFIDPPATPKILPPSPPSSSNSTSDGDDDIQLIAELRTPRAQRMISRDLLQVEEVREVRRSPRRSKPSQAIEPHAEGARINNGRGSSGMTTVTKEFKENHIGQSSIRKTKRAGVGPVLNIPDESESESESERESEHGNQHQDFFQTVQASTKEKDVRSDAAHRVLVDRQKSRSKPTKSTSAVTNRLITKTLATSSVVNSTTIKANPRAKTFIPTTQPSTSHPVPSRTANTKNKPNPNTRAVGRASTTENPTLVPLSRNSKPPKPKTPRKAKARILKASEGGVAHDKPLISVAARAQKTDRARSKVKSSKDAVSGQAQEVEVEVKRDDNRKTGEKRRTMGESGITTRKRVRKE